MLTEKELEEYRAEGAFMRKYRLSLGLTMIHVEQLALKSDGTQMVYSGNLSKYENGKAHHARKAMGNETVNRLMDFYDSYALEHGKTIMYGDDGMPCASTDKETTNICFDCAKAVGRCPWSCNSTPVPGWTAEKVIDERTGKFITWHITECPRFVRDKENKE